MKKFIKGVTIIELIIYMALVSIFLVILVEIFTSILKLELTTQSSSALAQDARFIVARMGYDIENASSISVPSLNSLQFDTTSSYSIDADRNLILTVGGVAARLNGSDTKISDIAFRQIGAVGTKPTVQVIFAISSDIIEQSGLRNMVIQTTYGTR